jgi:hypothetical protein
MFRIPSMELIAFSNGSVICDSMISELALYNWCESNLQDQSKEILEHRGKFYNPE